MDGFHWHLGSDGSLHDTSVDNMFGGHDYFHPDGSPVLTTHHNIFGGHDYFNDHGDYKGGSIPIGMPHTPGFHHADGDMGAYPHMFDTSNDPFHANLHAHFSGIRTNLLDQIQ